MSLIKLPFDGGWIKASRIRSIYTNAPVPNGASTMFVEVEAGEGSPRFLFHTKKDAEAARDELAKEVNAALLADRFTSVDSRR